VLYHLQKLNLKPTSPKHIMKIELITNETASASVKSLLDQVKQTYGFVPNTYGVFAHSPLAVAAYLQLNGLIKEHSTLTPQEQQVSARKLLLRGACRVEPGRGAGSGCEGVWGERGAFEG